MSAFSKYIQLSQTLILKLTLIQPINKKASNYGKKKKKGLKHMLNFCNTSSPIDLITGHRHLRYHLEPTSTAPLSTAQQRCNPFYSKTSWPFSSFTSRGQNFYLQTVSGKAPSLLTKDYLACEQQYLILKLQGVLTCLQLKAIQSSDCSRV